LQDADILESKTGKEIAFRAGLKTLGRDVKSTMGRNNFSGECHFIILGVNAISLANNELGTALIYVKAGPHVL